MMQHVPGMLVGRTATAMRMHTQSNVTMKSVRWLPHNFGSRE